MSGERRRSGGRPLVVVPHGSRSVPPLQVAAAAEGICDLLWLVRSDDPELAVVGRLLGRLGTVVDVAGLGPEQAAAVATHRPQGVVAFRDQDLEPVADLAFRLGLSFHLPSVAHRLADKAAQRRALAGAGLPVPGWWVLPAAPDPATVAAIAQRVRYPAVVKPRSGSGSRHTLRVDGPGALAAVFRALAARPAGGEPMMVEEYLADLEPVGDRSFADYVSVETLADGNGFRHLAVTGRLPLAEPFRETGFFVPSDLGPDQTAAVLATATAALEALGVGHGCCHTEVKWTPDGPRVIEVNGRMGGGVPDLLRVAAGADLLGLCLRSALGEPVAGEGLLSCDRVGYRLFLQPPPSARVIRSVDGVQAVGGLPGVDDVSLHLHPGDPLDPWEGSRTFVLAVVGAAADHEGVLWANDRMYELAGATYDHAGEAIEGIGPVGALTRGVVV